MLKAVQLNVRRYNWLFVTNGMDNMAINPCDSSAWNVFEDRTNANRLNTSPSPVSCEGEW